MSTKLLTTSWPKLSKVVDRRFLEQNLLIRRKVMELLEKGDLERVSVELERFGGRYSIPPEILLRQLEIFEVLLRGAKKEIQETITRIQEAIRAQILYLPTYRRIERELGSIFEGIDPMIYADIAPDSVNELERHTLNSLSLGMKDVQQAVDRTLERLKEFARESLNNLTLRYLGDVVNWEYQNVGMKEIGGRLRRHRPICARQNPRKHSYKDAQGASIWRYQLCTFR